MARFSLDWSSADLQGTIPGGVYDTREEAEAMIDCFLNEMLDQCADEDGRDGIRAGRFDVTELDD